MYTVVLMDSQIVEWGEFSLSVLALVSLVKNVFFTFAMFIYLVNVWGEIVYSSDAACLSVDLSDLAAA